MSKPANFPCPHCKKPSVWQDNPYRPFCSERCKLIDLGVWASEGYKIPGQNAPELSEKTPDDELDD